MSIMWSSVFAQLFILLYYITISVSKFVCIFLSWLPSEFTDVPQEIIHSDRDALCAHLPYGSVSWGSSHQWWVFSLTETEMPAKCCTQFDSLPLSSISSLSTSYLPCCLFLSVLCGLYCPLFSLLNGSNGHGHTYLWIFVGLIPKDCHLQKMSCFSYIQLSFSLFLYSLWYCFFLLWPILEQLMLL